MQHEERVRRRRFLQVLSASSATLLGAPACATTLTAPTLGAARVIPQADPTATTKATAVTSGSGPTQSAATQPASTLSASAPEPALTLNPTEYAFVEAAVDTLIPADDLSPSGAACGVAVFIDRQLAGAFGSGARLYRSGPFLQGKPEHGYQLALTPRELFGSTIVLVNTRTQREHGRSFDVLSEAERSAVLSALESGASALPAGQIFFELLLTLTMEGFFADPMYGGNRDKAAWKMVGYPGLPATYQGEIADYHGRRFDRAPQSIIDFC